MSVRSADEVLAFWFDELKPKHHWSKNPELDRMIVKRFHDTHQAACAGELFSWRSRLAGRLAEIIVLDQFSRNMFRDTPRAFTQDFPALVLSQEAVGSGAFDAVPDDQRAFCLMPYMHSESRLIHSEALVLFREFAPGNLDFELKHKRIIDRFGRFPHRNKILGRESTAEELEFLSKPGSSF